MSAKTIACLTLLLVLACPAAWAAKEAKKAATVSELEAYEMLQAEPKTTFMVDVRTREEFALLGRPPQAYNVPWRFLTDNFQVQGGPFQGGKATHTGYQLNAEPNPDFVGVVQSLFKLEDRIVVLSSDGDDGADAADALSRAGFKRVYNIRNGFQGDRLSAKESDRLAERHSPHWSERGRVNGWVFWGLPVSHVIDPRYVYPPDLKRMQTGK